MRRTETRAWSAVTVDSHGTVSPTVLSVRPGKRQGATGPRLYRGHCALLPAGPQREGGEEGQGEEEETEEGEGEEGAGQVKSDEITMAWFGQNRTASHQQGESA